MDSSISIAVRSSSGIGVNLGPPKFGPNEEFEIIKSKVGRAMLFSESGEYLAYISDQNLHIIETKNWDSIAVIKGIKAYHLAFSPKGTYLCSWEYFAVNNSNPHGAPNLNIYDTKNGDVIKNFVCKKQSNWEPQWSLDELLCSRMVNTDVVFYENANYDNVVCRLNSHKVASYSLSPTSGAYFVICHTLGGPGQPSFMRLFKYPNFENQQSLANKSFFQADKVEYYWNSKGTHILLLAMTEVDKTGGSYYGKQSLHFIGTNGQTAMVTLGKEGPIYNVAWSPKNQEFCVVYGFMPSKCTLFNLKCEPIFEFGTGPRNSIYYNPHGNILLIGGFGNLQGQVEIWEASTKKVIGKCDAPDSTLLNWCPDGIYFLTATTAPRLRTGNGYKIWHYSGVLIHEVPWSKEEELYEVCWQNLPKNTFKEPTISYEKVAGIASSQPQASKEAYRPPSARNRPPVRFTLHDDDDSPHKPAESAPSKATLKQKKKRENRKARKQEEGEEGNTLAGSGSPTVVSSVQVVLTGDPEKDKKIKNIKKEDVGEKVEDEKNALECKKRAALQKLYEAKVKNEQAEDRYRRLKVVMEVKTKISSELSRECAGYNKRIEELQAEREDIDTKYKNERKDLFNKLEALQHDYCNLPGQFDNENINEAIANARKLGRLYKEEIVNASKELEQLKSSLERPTMREEVANLNLDALKVIQKESMEKYGDPNQLQKYLTEKQKYHDDLRKQIQDLKVKHGIP